MPEVTRKLAAIMFTDIVGYTVLMSKDERKALQVLQRNLDILKPCVKKFKGEWLKEIGDGTLSSFPSAVDAVNCALEIQRTLRDDPDFTIRIGIHIGDVVFKEGDIYGDGVNVASRIEPLAKPGGICVSGRVYDDIRNKPNIDTSFLGEKTLKNVDRPIKVYAIIGEILPGPAVEPSIPKEPEVEIEKKVPPIDVVKKKPVYFYVGLAVLVALVILIGIYFFPEQREVIDSIAVLPLENLSGDPKQDYFVNGMTEALITELSKINALKVISRQSIMRFKGSTEPLSKIAGKLNVDALVEGSVLLAGEQIRITAQLIDAVADRHLWAEDYERDFRDILSLQKEVAQAIAREIAVEMTPQDEARLGQAQAVDPEAFKLYLRGLHFRYMDSYANYKRAAEFFEQSIAKDPYFAPAYAGLATSYTLLGLGGTDELSYKEAELKARQAVTEALKLDETLPEAHIAMGVLRVVNDWNWEGAEQAFQRAIELNPGSSDALREYGLLLARTGRNLEKGLAEAKRGVELDPLWSTAHRSVGEVYLYSRQYDQAIESCRIALEIEPNYLTAHWLIGWAYVYKGMYKEAIVEFKKVSSVGSLGYTYAVSGRQEEALKLLDELMEKRRKGRIGLEVSIANIYIGLDERDQALTWLEKAYEERSGLIRIKVDPIYDPLRSDPRFQALVKKMGLEK